MFSNELINLLKIIGTSGITATIISAIVTLGLGFSNHKSHQEDTSISVATELRTKLNNYYTGLITAQKHHNEDKLYDDNLFRSMGNEY